MICPKCGNEFEGTTCPKCNSPAILVNASDYERRRREWEEREKQKNSEEQKRQKNRENVRRVAKKIADTDYSQLVSSNADRAAGFALRNRRILTMAGAVVAAAIVIIILVNAVISSGNNVLYVSDGSSIYKGMDKNSSICGEDEVIFNYDKSRAYPYNIAGGIDKDSIIETMTSPGGRYYAAVLYSEDDSGSSNNSVEVSGSSNAGQAYGTNTDSANAYSTNKDGTVNGDDSQYIGESNSSAVNGNALSTGTYTLVCWKKNGEAVSVKSSADKKRLIMITDEGMLVYTDTHYLNEGAVGAELLGCYYADDNRNMTLSSDVDEYAVADDNVIWTDSDGTLYRIKHNDSSPTKIAHNVRDIYTGQNGDMYVRADGSVQAEAAFVYATQDGEYIYFDWSDKKNQDGTYLFRSSSQTDSIVYISKTGRVYTAGGGKLSVISGIKESASSDGTNTDTRKTEVISGLASASIYYSSDTGILYYVNKSDELVAVKNAAKGTGAGTVVSSGITQSGLQSAVYGSGGFWYTAQTSLYYCDGSSGQLKLKDDARQGAVIYCTKYKNKIYCLYDGTLSRISAGGSVQMETAGIADIWTGRIRVR